MPFLLDTSVAIYLRDGEAAIVSRIVGLPSKPLLSMIGRIELENGVVRNPGLAVTRRRALDLMLSDLEVLDFDASCADAYRAIVEAIGYSRPRVTDRMIAATAIVHGATLVTINGADFADIPGLDLEVWPSI